MEFCAESLRVFGTRALMITFSGLSLVIIISPFLNGFGFSTPPLTAGLTVLVNLMTPGSVNALCVCNSSSAMTSRQSSTSPTCTEVSPTFVAIFALS